MIKNIFVFVLGPTTFLSMIYAFVAYILEDSFWIIHIPFISVRILVAFNILAAYTYGALFSKNICDILTKEEETEIA